MVDTRPPVFSVRVANKGLMLDAASRFAGKGVTEGIVWGLEGSKVGMWKGKEEPELGALRLRTQERFVGEEIGEENMWNGSMGLARE
jgi:hypothetical protein